MIPDNDILNELNVKIYHGKIFLLIVAGEGFTGGGGIGGGVGGF